MILVIRYVADQGLNALAWDSGLNAAKVYHFLLHFGQLHSLLDPHQMYHHRLGQ